MAWHVRHFPPSCCAPESPVKRLRKSKAARNHRTAHQFRLPGERKSMARDLTPGNRALHPRAALRSGLLQIAVDQPGSGRPHVLRSVRARLAQLLGNADRLRIEAGEVSL